MADAQKAATLGELRKSGHRVLPVREEIRQNLMARMREGTPLFPGVMGFDDTVVPQVENAVLAGQDIIFLGERGQAKSRIIRSLVDFLDEETPVVRGCEINDNPFNPICLSCRTRHRRAGRRPRESTGSPATSGTRRSWPPPTSPSPTSSARSTPSRSPRAATSPTS